MKAQQNVRKNEVRSFITAIGWESIEVEGAVEECDEVERVSSPTGAITGSPVSMDMGITGPFEQFSLSLPTCRLFEFVWEIN